MLNIEENMTTQAILRNQTIKLFQRLVEAKFRPPSQAMEQMREALQRLSLTDLETLFSEIVAFKTIQQLRRWIKDHELAPPVAEDTTIRPENKQLLSLLEEWYSQPDDLGDEWWDEFDAELYENRLNFPQRDII